ncbi:MAG: hypothetical protein M3Q22_04760 [Actinomycetota bacterium]|nr:hypothetical protein [Actinomycetota bacterium]
MTEPLNNFEAGRLAANARMYEPNELLDRAADLFENDRPAWERLPARTRDLSIVHKDMRDLYRAAVRARLIPDDRPSAA